MSKLAHVVLPLLLAAPATYAQQAEPQAEPRPDPPQQAGSTGRVPEEPRQEPRRSGFRIGPNVGVFSPTSSKTRERFGGAWYSLGPGLGIVRRASARGRIALDFNLMRQKRGGNRAFVIPIGASYVRALGRAGEGRSALPFAGVALLAIPGKLKSVPDGVDSGLKLGAGAAAFVGTTFGERAFIEARYMATTRIEGFSLSGASLRAGLRF